MCMRGKAGNGEASVVSGDRENRVLFHAQRTEVSYKLDGSIIKLSVALRASVGSSLHEFSRYGKLVTGEHYCNGGE